MVKMKKCVNLYTESGFTMLEMVYSFAIFLIVVSFLPIITHFLLSFNNGGLSLIEWEVFMQQAKQEVRRADDIYVLDNSLVMRNYENIVTYEKYKDKIRRRVFNSGHEVILQNVKNVSFQEINKGVKLSVTMKDGNEYEAVFLTYLNKEEGEIID